MDERAQPQVDTDAIVDAWFVERIHNSPLTRDGVHATLLRAAADELKERLRTAAGASPVVETAARDEGAGGTGEGE